MVALLANLIPFLLLDILNPVLFALMVVAIATDRPMANSTALLAGHTASYFVSGVIIALGLDQITDRLNNPLTIDFVLELVIGVLCLWVALTSRDGKSSEAQTHGGELTLAYCFGYGAVINFIGVPFALPYFAAIDQLLKANLSVESSLLVLALYNGAYALPFLLVPILVALLGDRCKPILHKFSTILTSLVDRIMPALLALLGCALAADALMYLVTGDALW